MHALHVVATRVMETQRTWCGHSAADGPGTAVCRISLASAQAAPATLPCRHAAAAWPQRRLHPPLCHVGTPLLPGLSAGRICRFATVPGYRGNHLVHTPNPGHNRRPRLMQQHNLRASRPFTTELPRLRKQAPTLATCPEPRHCMMGCLVHGAWCKTPMHGAWCMVHGARHRLPGAWCLVHGAWCVAQDTQPMPARHPSCSHNWRRPSLHAWHLRHASNTPRLLTHWLPPLAPRAWHPPQEHTQVVHNGSCLVLDAQQRPALTGSAPLPHLQDGLVGTDESVVAWLSLHTQTHTEARKTRDDA